MQSPLRWSHNVKYAVECCCVESSKCTGPKCDANRKRVDHLVYTKHLLWWFIKTQRLHNGMLFLQPLVFCLGFLVSWTKDHGRCDVKKKIFFLMFSPNICNLHWLPVAARIWFRTMLRTELHPSTSKHRSDHLPKHDHYTTTSAGRLVQPSLSANKVCNSSVFWRLIDGTIVRTAESLTIFKRLKTHLFSLHLNHA